MLFNAKVDIIEVEKAKDSYGSYTEIERVSHYQIPCRINWLRGREKIQFDRKTYYRDARVYCRPISVNTNDRIRYGGTKYEIVDVANIDNLGKLMTIDIKKIDDVL